jgi:hypothetical protein
MSDERYDSYHVAAAYLDGAGGRVLEAALGRGADVTLVMPRNPNVYHDANRKALAKLVHKYGDVGAGAGAGVAGAAGDAAGGKGAGRRFTEWSTQWYTRGYTREGSTQGKGLLTAYMCDDMLHAKVGRCTLTPPDP